MPSTTLLRPASNPRSAVGPAQAPSKPVDFAPTFFRTVALIIVVLWHWGFATVRWDAAGPHSGNPLHLVPGGFLITWFLQIMPVFFIIGGWASHGSLTRHLDNGRPVGAWVRKRALRLAVPVLPLVGALIFAKVALSPWAFGVALLAVSPLWFLGVYLPLTALTPILVRWHRRSPIAAMLAAVAAVGVVQYARFVLDVSGIAITLLSFLVVWGTAYQLGFFFDDVRRDPNLARRCVIVGAAGMTIGWVLGYSLSMVTTVNDKISNMGPPTMQIVFLAMFQLGLVGLVASRVDALQHRANVRRLIDWIDANQMRIYAIHLPIWVAFLVLARHTPVALGGTPSLTWLALRPFWTIVPGIVLIVVLRRRAADASTKIIA